MYNLYGTLLLIACASTAALTGSGALWAQSSGMIPSDPSGSRRRVLFDAGWRFHRGDAKGAQKPGFDDSKWRAPDLPHDFMLEGDFVFEKDFHHVGWLDGGVGWYRKTFRLPGDAAGKKVFIEFEGVYNNCDVWINGRHLGNRFYGYSTFQYDLTEHVNFGGDNVIAVRVNNEQPCSRWYSGAGIYRHVWLTVTNKVHVAHWGTYVTTPKVTAESATVNARTIVVNESDKDRHVTLIPNIFDAKGAKVATRVKVVENNHKIIPAGEQAEFSHNIRVSDPRLWSVDDPQLYKLKTQVMLGDEKTDEYQTTFGIRKIEFDADRGFLLNGRQIKLKGVNLHHDNGPLGACAYDRAEARKIELMKSYGANALRTAHNPPSPAILDACDRLGMLVMDEAFDEWKHRKTKYGYSGHFEDNWKKDIEAMVLRDRNHPCVIIWSIGNEIPDLGHPEGVQRTKDLSDYVRRLDPTRPVGQGTHPGHVDNKHSPDFFAHLDVCGYNYKFLYEKHHKKFPNRIMFGSESFPSRVYWNWKTVFDHDYLLGDFTWTGMEYLGEAGLGAYYSGIRRTRKVYHSMCGDFDLCGFAKPQAYYRRAVWNDEPVVRIAVGVIPPKGVKDKPAKWGWKRVRSSWTWDYEPGTKLNVDVYSGCDEVELFLNGESLGKKPTGMNNRQKRMGSWKVPYRPGVLEAVGYNNGKKAAGHVLRTAGEPTKIVLTPDRSEIRADGQDLSFVKVEVTDAEGVRNHLADNEITFEVEGSGSLAGAGGANPFITEGLKLADNKARSHLGRCLAVVKSAAKGGKIRLTAAAPGLEPATVVITAK